MTVASGEPPSHEVPEVASQTIQPPADQHIEAAPASIGDKLVQGGPAVLGARDAPVHVLACGPTAGGDVAKLVELILRFLVTRP